MDLKIKGLVKHNGKWYKPGQEIKKAKQPDGERLVKLGVADSIGKQDDPPKEPTEPPKE